MPDIFTKEELAQHLIERYGVKEAKAKEIAEKLNDSIGELKFSTLRRCIAKNLAVAIQENIKVAEALINFARENLGELVQQPQTNNGNGGINVPQNTTINAQNVVGGNLVTNGTQYSDEKPVHSGDKVEGKTYEDKVTTVTGSITTVGNITNSQHVNIATGAGNTRFWNSEKESWVFDVDFTSDRFNANGFDVIIESGIFNAELVNAANITVNGGSVLGEMSCGGMFTLNGGTIHKDVYCKQWLQTNGKMRKNVWADKDKAQCVGGTFEGKFK